MKPRQKYPFEHSLFLFASFAVVGGFLEAFTFLLHGGVFCNAQTGNLVLLTLNLCQARFSLALHYIWSLLAYVAGIFVSALLPRLLKKINIPLCVSVIEACALAALAFQPITAPDQITYVSVSFLCALQYNTFTHCRGASLATTFCTNNLRQTVLNLYDGIADKNKTQLKKSAIYALIILSFTLGAAAGALSAPALKNYSILICSAVLLPTIVALAVSSFRHKNLNQASTENSDSQVSEFPSTFSDQS